MRPILNQVFVRPFPPDDISAGGIIVPDSCKKTSNKVTIVATGNGSKARPMHLKAGDVGFRVKDWGTEVLLDGEKHFIMDMGDIIALLK